MTAWPQVTFRSNNVKAAKDAAEPTLLFLPVLHRMLSHVKAADAGMDESQIKTSKMDRDLVALQPGKGTKWSKTRFLSGSSL